MTTTSDWKSRAREAQTHARAGRDDQAEALWRSILEEAPDAGGAATGLADLLDRRGDVSGAQDVLRRLIDAAPTHAHVLAAARLWQRWEGSAVVRAALTGHGTLDSLADHLRVASAQAGVPAAVYCSGFDQWAQDLLPPTSPLYAFAPDVVFLRLDPAALFPRTAADPFADADALDAERRDGIAQVRGLLEALARSAPAATVVVHTFPLPEFAPLGVADLTAPESQRARFEALNADLIALIRERAPRALALDQERLEARFGKERVRDERMWFLGSLPFSDAFLPAVAREQTRFLRALKGKTRKCVVLDLDNTLWGGVVGEDGVEKLKLGGQSAPGNAFAAFQRALDVLRRRGILLAVCSKNNPDDALPAIESHPEMVLRKESFAALRINWQDKATNLVEIARELNIGLDSLVFLDDNPAERGQVRQRLPDVLVPELPRDPALYARALQELDVFDTLTLTAEDRSRSQLYAQQQERQAFAEQAAAGDLHAYLHGLDMSVRLGRADAYTLPRIAQLLNKTNQFNVTTRRYTEAQVADLAGDASAMVCWAHVRDKFGDSGLTGVAIARSDGDAWEVDSFLLSCRVMGRGVEDALLRYVAEAARAAGANRLRGRFIPTAKNAPAADFFSRMGFAPTGEGEEPGATLWERTLSAETDPGWPAWLRVELED